MLRHEKKLELIWIGKEHRPKLEPRILLEDPAKSYHTKHRMTENDRGAADRFSNLTLKKIPKMVLQKCEWGHDDHSLKVENSPVVAPPQDALTPALSQRERGQKVAGEGRKTNPGQRLGNPARGLRRACAVRAKPQLVVRTAHATVVATYNHANRR